MKASERRKELVHRLASEREALSGTHLAECFGVSRQIIVQDIAHLKKIGYEIVSTHRGYVLHKAPLVERVFKVRHTSEDTEDELASIVSLGGTVVDVFVWHKVYGRISAPLNIFSRSGIKQFIEGVRSGRSVELMTITGGYHYHTVRAESEETLDRIHGALSDRGYIAPEI